MDCTGRLKRFWTRVTLHRLPGGVHQGNELTRNSSSQLAVALWTDPGLMSGIDTRELISALKKKKRRRLGMICRTFSQNLRLRGKSHHLLLMLLLLTAETETYQQACRP